MTTGAQGVYLLPVLAGNKARLGGPRPGVINQESPQGMGLEFISRVIKTSVIVSLIQLPFVALYFDYRIASGIVLGCLWGIVNLHFLKVLLVCYTELSKIGKRRLLLLLLLKFPLLYLFGYLLLRADLFPILSLLGGFTLMFVVVVLKALGRWLLSLESFKVEGSAFYRRGSGGQS